MICEPNLYLSQRVDLKSMAESKETAKDVKEKLEKSPIVKTKVTYVQKEYNLLPLFKDQFEYLNDVLSLKTNEYLACRWNSFVDDVPEDYIRIRLYLDYKKTLEDKVVRRKILNGHFYGMDNKLAPIPQSSDPRNLGKKKELSKKINKKI